WLREVERRAALAEGGAGLAAAAAAAGAWRGARDHARRARALEVHTGRALRRPPPPWQRLHEAIDATAPAPHPLALDLISRRALYRPGDSRPAGGCVVRHGPPAGGPRLTTPRKASASRFSHCRRAGGHRESGGRATGPGRGRGACSATGPTPGG